MVETAVPGKVLRVPELHAQRLPRLQRLPPHPGEDQRRRGPLLHLVSTQVLGTLTQA